MKLEGVPCHVGVGKTAGIILQLQPTLVWKLAEDGGKRMEIETTVLKDNVKVWQATIAAFGPGNTENEQLVIDFIGKIRNEMSDDNIIL